MLLWFAVEFEVIQVSMCFTKAAALKVFELQHLQDKSWIETGVPSAVKNQELGFLCSSARMALLTTGAVLDGVLQKPDMHLEDSLKLLVSLLGFFYFSLLIPVAVPRCF